MTLVDTTGKFCPVPILELARALKATAAGEAVEIVATDPAFEADLTAFCQSTGHRLESWQALDGVFRARVRKAGR